jgi:hypothetical protein
MQLGDQLAPSSAAPGTSGCVCACLFFKKKATETLSFIKNEINEIHTITSEGIAFRFRVGRFLTETPIHHLHHEKHPLKLQLHKAQKHLNNHHYRRTMQAWKVQKKTSLPSTAYCASSASQGSLNFCHVIYKKRQKTIHQICEKWVRHTEISLLK